MITILSWVGEKGRKNTAMPKARGAIPLPTLTVFCVVSVKKGRTSPLDGIKGFLWPRTWRTMPNASHGTPFGKMVHDEYSTDREAVQGEEACTPPNVFSVPTDAVFVWCRHGLKRGGRLPPLRDEPSLHSGERFRHMVWAASAKKNVGIVVPDGPQSAALPPLRGVQYKTPPKIFGGVGCIILRPA